MGYSAEVMQRARARLAAAKADRESENQQHLAVAYERIPRLREIDKQLRLTMAMAAQAAFSRGGDVQAMMNEAREKNLSLQREREILVNTYFEEGYLDDSPICDRCGCRSAPAGRRRAGRHRQNAAGGINHGIQFGSSPPGTGQTGRGQGGSGIRKSAPPAHCL